LQGQWNFDPSKGYQFKTELSYKKGKQVIEIDSPSFLGGMEIDLAQWLIVYMQKQATQTPSYLRIASCYKSSKDRKDHVIEKFWYIEQDFLLCECNPSHRIFSYVIRSTVFFTSAAGIVKLG
jgi:hypothetical protein